MTTPTLGDERRLWGAYGVSEFGSAVSMGALPLVALTVLHVPGWQVSFLAAVGGLTSALLAVPLGPVIEHRRKRPTMIIADLGRALALVSVPVAAWMGVLTFAQLCVVSIVTTTGAIAFTAASSAHLAWLLPEERRLGLLSRLESTLWLSSAVGPPIGGAVIAAVGATATLALDAVSFILSALGVRSIRTTEPPGATFEHEESAWRASAAAGWRVIRGDRVLRSLFANAMLFGGALMMAYPLQTVLMLRDLGFSAWQYGLALGLPALGGFTGAMLGPRLNRRLGERRVMLVAGVMRTLWLVPVACAPRGAWGLVVIVAADGALLLSAGLFNPVFSAYRMRVTPEGHLARVTMAWSIGSRLVQPVAMLLGAALVTVIPLRGVIVVAATLLLMSALVLPWQRRADMGD